MPLTNFEDWDNHQHAASWGYFFWRIKRESHHEPTNQASKGDDWILHH